MFVGLLKIMGEFLSYGYMNAHTKDHRMGESNYMNEKFEAYKVALFTPTSGEEEEEELTPDKRRDPRPFRPSSSRKEPLLSSIGFNGTITGLLMMLFFSDYVSSSHALPIMIQYTIKLFPLQKSQLTKQAVDVVENQKAYSRISPRVLQVIILEGLEIRIVLFRVVCVDWKHCV